MTVAIGAAGLQYLLRRDVGDTNDWPVIPAAHRAGRSPATSRCWGDWRGAPSPGSGSGMNLMPLAMDCASGAPAGATQRQRAQLEPYAVTSA